MKKTRMIQIIELILLAVIAIGLIAFLSRMSKNTLHKEENTNFDFSFNLGSSIGKMLKEEQVNSTGIEKIRLDFDSADIEVTATDEKVIRVIESSNKPLKKHELFTLTNQNGILEIIKGERITHIPFLNFGFQQHKIELFIPKSYRGDLDIVTSSGDISALSELKLNNITTQQASGDLQIDYPLEGRNFNSNLASGDVAIKHLECNKYTIGVASGDIDVDYLKGSGAIEASSGDITIGTLSGEKYSIDASSGDINLQGVSGTGEVHANSGDITVKLSENISLEMDAKCISGDIEGDIDIEYKNKKGSEATAAVGEAPYAKLTINTNSGDITVNKN